MAQAPAKSFEVISIEDTPSPARTGRSGSSAVAAGSASTQSWPLVKRPGKSRSRKKVLVSTWSRGTGSSSGMSSEDRIERSATMPGPCISPPGPGGEMQGPGMVALRSILSSLDIPELEPVPRDHVLTKTFYLLRDFPGRFSSGQTWVEALPREEDDEASSKPARGGDGVSPIIITSNDLAGAWAIRPDGQPMLPLSPGEPRQREFAFRAGVNIVMYTLTGNYKADQVHAPALIERLGQ